MFCCCFNNSNNNNNNNNLINEQKRNERVIISSRTINKTEKQYNNNNNNDNNTTNDNDDNDNNYEPPQLLEQRLSLPISPAQRETSRSNTLKHRKKSGYVKKKGHLVKNWKKRYLILKDGLLTYYESASTTKKDENGFYEGISKKGWTTLEGAKIELFSENPCRLNVITPVADKSLLIETDSPEDTEDWYNCIIDAIRASNITSLCQGNRIPQVVQWYMEEYSSYEEARKVLEFGHLFKLHYIDPTGVIHLIKVWLQANSNGLGLVFYVSLDGQNPPPAASEAISPIHASNTGNKRSNTTSNTKMPLSARFDGLEVNFNEIVSITKGTSENVYKTKDMGPDSAFFTMKTADATYVLEVETRAKRDRWSMAIRDTVNFVHIPTPGLRRSQHR